MAAFSAELSIYSLGPNHLVLPNHFCLVSKFGFLVIRVFSCKAPGSLVSPLVARVCIVVQQISAQNVSQKICLLSTKSKQALRRYCFKYEEEVEAAPKRWCFLCRPPGEEGDGAGSVFGNRPALPHPSQHLGASHLPPGEVRWAKAASGNRQGEDAQTSFRTEIAETESRWAKEREELSGPSCLLGGGPRAVSPNDACIDERPLQRFGCSWCLLPLQQQVVWVENAGRSPALGTPEMSSGFPFSIEQSKDEGRAAHLLAEQDSTVEVSSPLFIHGHVEEVKWRCLYL